MKEVNLDPTKLLGFRMLSGGTTAKLCSPKIGAKACINADEDTSARTTRRSPAVTGD